MVRDAAGLQACRGRVWTSISTRGSAGVPMLERPNRAAERTPAFQAGECAAVYVVAPLEKKKEQFRQFNIRAAYSPRHWY